MNKDMFTALLIAAFISCYSTVLTQDVFVSNLDEDCLKCLCYAASDCMLDLGCRDGNCGPFQLSRGYWIDAGRPTLLHDNRNTDRAFKNCALTLPCAEGTVKHYLAKYAMDCNGDGITNCDDFAMMNFNGAFDCEKPLNRNADGRLYLQRYKKCGN